MAVTTGYRAGFEPSDVEFLWFPELVYGQSQDGGAITWNRARFLSEGLRGEKNRISPPEIRSDKQMGDYVTTEFTAGGDLSTPLVKESMTEIMAAAINADATTGTFQNGTDFKSFTLIKRYSPTVLLEYLGSQPVSMTLEVQTGQFLSLAFNFLCKNEEGLTTDLVSTIGSIDTNKIMDPVNSVATISWGGSNVNGCSMVRLQTQKQGAENQYELGSEAAAGTSQGQLMVSGNLSTYFNDLTLYDDFKSETSRELILSVLDDTSGGYTFTLPNARIMNPSIVASGPGPAIIAEFNVEATPGPGGYTIEIAEVP